MAKYTTSLTQVSAQNVQLGSESEGKFLAAITILTGVAVSGISLAGQDLIQANSNGNGETVGTVTVTDHSGTLNVSFEMNFPFLLFEAHSAAGLSCEDIPQTKKGNPKVGKFESSWESAGFPGSSVVNLTLNNTYPAGAEICVAAHAVVYDSTGGATHEEAFINTAESAWADGDGFPGRNWATNFQFQLALPSCIFGASCTAFVTSRPFTADLVSEAAALGLGDFTGDGIGAGDAICNDLAQTALLPGTFKVWLSYSLILDPESRFVQAAVPYIRTDGTPIAANWPDLTDASLSAPLNVDENQNPTGFAEVWAATSPVGTYDGLSTCAGWTSTVAAPARFGRNDLTDSRWTEWIRNDCSTPRRLYCFEQ